MNLLFPAVILLGTAGFLLLSHKPTAAPMTPSGPGPAPRPNLPPGPNPNAGLLAQYNQLMAQAVSDPNGVDLAAMEALQNQLDIAGLTAQSVQLGTKISEIKITRATGQATAGWAGPSTGASPWGRSFTFTRQHPQPTEPLVPVQPGTPSLPWPTNPQQLLIDYNAFMQQANGNPNGVDLNAMAALAAALDNAGLPAQAATLRSKAAQIAQARGAPIPGAETLTNWAGMMQLQRPWWR